MRLRCGFKRRKKVRLVTTERFSVDCNKADHEILITHTGPKINVSTFDAESAKKAREILQELKLCYLQVLDAFE